MNDDNFTEATKLLPTRVRPFYHAKVLGHWRSQALTELVDMYPIICTALGVGVPTSVQGLSLMPVLKNPDHRLRTAAISIYEQGYGLRSDKWSYMRYYECSEELYDMDSDPQQFTNLASLSTHAATCRVIAPIFSAAYFSGRGAEKNNCTEVWRTQRGY